MSRILILTVFLGLAAAAFLVVDSPHFRLQELAVEGLEELNPQDIWAWIQVAPGEHLWAINLSSIEKRLETNPRVDSASVQRVLPGRLLVTVEERSGVLLVPHHQGYLELDPGGWALAWHEDPVAPGLPVATGLSLGELVVGERGSTWGLDECLQLALALGQARGEISEINISQGRLYLYTLEGVSVLWGEAREDFEAKMEVLKAFLNDPAPGIRYLDLRVASVPVMGD